MPNNVTVRPARYVIPAIESGYELTPGVGQFGVILPLGADKANLVINPSVETNTTGYSVNIGGSIARDSTVQKFGVYSLKCTPSASSTDGWQYDTVSLVAGTQYVASVWFKGKQNLKYRIDFLTTGGIGLGSPTQFIATGFWQRVSVTYLETVTTTRRVYVRKDSQTNVAPFWTDGLQVEAYSLTTYIDGDRTGFVRNRADYYWTGTPHASTSVRIGQSRSGGKVISLNDLGFRLLSIIGLGMGGIVNQLTPLARGGAYYGGTVISDRQFTLVGQVDDSSGYLQLARKRQALIDLFKPDIVSPVQPVVLRYTPTDDCGNQQGNEQEIVCVYQDGLAGRTDNLNAERLGLQFQLYLPFVMQEVGNSGGTLAYQSTIVANGVALRNALGQWAVMGTGATTGGVTCSIRMPNGDIVVGGVFTDMGGVAAADNIARWDGTAWNAMGTGANGAVTSFTLDAAGILYAGGQFASMGGVANTRGIAKWNGSAWLAMGTGASTNGVEALTTDFQGNVWAGGDYALMGGVANTVRIAKWNTTTLAWSALGLGSNGIVFALMARTNGLVFAGGIFTILASNPVSGVAAWYVQDAVPSPSPLAGGIDGLVFVRALIDDPNGNLYVGGGFTGAGGVVTNAIARFNGTAWSALGAGLVSGDVLDLGWDTLTNSLVAMGTFTSAGGFTTPDSIARFNGSAWLIIDIDPDPGSVTTVWEYQTFSDGRALIGWATTTSALVAGVNTVVNSGSAGIGVKLVMTGPGAVYAIKNYTTGKTIYFNLNILAGETVTLDMIDSSGVTFTSSFFGNILNKVLAGSNLSDFRLAPGSNSISLYIGGTVTAATVASLQWRNTYYSLDGAIPGRLLT